MVEARRRTDLLQWVMFRMRLKHVSERERAQSIESCPKRIKIRGEKWRVWAKARMFSSISLLSQTSYLRVHAAGGNSAHYLVVS